jgi:hypothetical protein
MFFSCVRPPTIVACRRRISAPHAIRVDVGLLLSAKLVADEDLGTELVI